MSTPLSFHLTVRHTAGNNVQMVRVKGSHPVDLQFELRSISCTLDILFTHMETLHVYACTQGAALPSCCMVEAHMLSQHRSTPTTPSPCLLVTHCTRMQKARLHVPHTALTTTFCASAILQQPRPQAAPGGLVLAQAHLSLAQMGTAVPPYARCAQFLGCTSKLFCHEAPRMRRACTVHVQ